MQTNEVMAFMPQSELKLIRVELELIKNLLTQKNEESLESQYIESKQVPKILKVSQRTWQTYRDSGKIPFIQFGQKVWVKWGDLENFMNQNYINKK